MSTIRRDNPRQLDDPESMEADDPGGTAELDISFIVRLKDTERHSLKS